MSAITPVANGTRTVTIGLESLDVLFFRDGRPFSEATRARSGLPNPQILCGAVRSWLLTQYGCNLGELGRAIRSGASAEHALTEVAEKAGASWIAKVRTRGPWLAKLNDDRADIFVPAPATLHRAKSSSKDRRPPVDGKAPSGGATGRLFRLDPLKPTEVPPGWRPLGPGMRPLWLRNAARTERVTGYLNLKTLERFLAGELRADSEGWSQPVSPNDLYDFDLRTGIAVDPNRLTAAQSMIYAASFLALKPGVGFAGEIVVPPDAPAELFHGNIALPFGGEGRRVLMRRVESIRWPNLSPRADAKTLLMLTTPGIFENSWCPKCLLEGQLVAAAVPGYEAVSGWDLARGGAKPTRFAVPAGSVYFIEGSLPEIPDSSLADRAEDRLQGWGCFVTGTWSDA